MWQIAYIFKRLHQQFLSSELFQNLLVPLPSGQSLSLPFELCDGLDEDNVMEVLPCGFRGEVREEIIRISVFSFLEH
jgi:hypothetical protein